MQEEELGKAIDSHKSLPLSRSQATRSVDLCRARKEAFFYWSFGRHSKLYEIRFAEAYEEHLL